MKTRSSLEAAGIKFRTKQISERVKRIVTSPIKEMRILAEKIPDHISFGQGIPYVDSPQELKDQLAQKLKTTDISKYSTSPGLPELRQSLAKHVMKKRSLTNVTEDNILVTVGAMEGLAAGIMTTINPQDEVIMMTPGFSSHIEQVLLADGIPKFVPLLENENWALDPQKIQDSITKKTKAMILCNPNNPTGSVFSKKSLKEVEKIVLENDLILLLDEPYDFLLYDDSPFYSPASNPKLKDNIISCFSFSKEFAMTGYRIGYVYADPGLINQMMKVHDALCICAPRISQEAAKIALSLPHDFTNDLIKRLDTNRKIVMQGLDEIPNLFSYNPPKGAYYIFPKYNYNMNSFDFCLKLLNEAKVETVPGAAFGSAGEQHIRMSFGSPPEQLEEGMRRLKKFSEKIGDV
jgi:aminotransferase